MTAGKVGMERPKGRLKIATKYVNLTRQYYASLGEQVDVIKAVWFNGACTFGWFG